MGNSFRDFEVDAILVDETANYEILQSTIGHKFNKELEDNSTLSQKLKLRASTDHIHTVLDGVKRYIVCLENKKCSCGQFQLDELPCAHALASLRHRNERPDNYCSSYYTTKSLLLTYELLVNPLPDEAKWDVPQHILVIPNYRNLMCNCNTF